MNLSWFSIVLTLSGVVVYALTQGKVARVAEICFFVGLLALTFQVSGQTLLHLGK